MIPDLRGQAADKTKRLAFMKSFIPVLVTVPIPYLGIASSAKTSFVSLLIIWDALVDLK
jgi:hypothetical protein